jgi:hypothetical protein
MANKCINSFAIAHLDASPQGGSRHLCKRYELKMDLYYE